MNAAGTNPATSDGPLVPCPNTSPQVSKAFSDTNTFLQESWRPTCGTVLPAVRAFMTTSMRGPSSSSLTPAGAATRTRSPVGVSLSSSESHSSTLEEACSASAMASLTLARAACRERQRTVKRERSHGVELKVVHVFASSIDWAYCVGHWWRVFKSSNCDIPSTQTMRVVSCPAKEGERVGLRHPNEQHANDVTLTFDC